MNGICNYCGKERAVAFVGKEICNSCSYTLVHIGDKEAEAEFDKYVRESLSRWR